MTELEKKRKELLQLEFQEKKKQYEKQCEKTLAYCNTLVNRCFKKEQSSKQAMFFRFLSVKHKTSSAESKNLLSITMNIDKRIMIRRPEKSFNREAVIYEFHQDNKYHGHLEEQVFKLKFDEETGEFDMKESIGNFMLFTSEIPTEMYEEAIEIAEDNSKKSLAFMEKHKLLSR